MRKFMIQRTIPGAGQMKRCELGDAAVTSNNALAKLGKGIQWQYSFVHDGGTFCVYLAENEELIHEHAKLSGFPANVITEITGMIDPSNAAYTTAHAKAETAAA